MSGVRASPGLSLVTWWFTGCRRATTGDDRSIPGQFLFAIAYVGTATF